jgi:acyl carrier protein
MTIEEIKSKTRQYLGKFFNGQHLNDNDDIFATGVVNSLFAMQLVMFIEKEFSIEINNNDLDLNNFKSIDAVSTLVASKSAVTG